VKPNETLTVATVEGVLANDTDADGDALTLTLVSNVTHGTLSLAPDGAFTYVPTAGYTGTDVFRYRVSDGTFSSPDATVTITIAQIGEDIVINEIMFRPGATYPEVTSREFIELHNRGTSPIDLTGWMISSGVTYAFPAGRIMAAGSYLVVAADVAAFQAVNPGVTNVIGGWIGTLSNGGEKIALTDAAGVELDSVKYSNEGDWATRIRETTFNGWDWRNLAETGGRTMELQNPSISNDNGQNWKESSTAGGTPGEANGSLTTNVPPIIKAVKHSPAVPQPTDRVLISCELNDELPDQRLNATLFWRNATSTTPGALQSVPMSWDGDAGWFAPLAPQPNLTIIEFYISATDGTLTRTWPAPTTEGQNANCQYQVDSSPNSTTTEMYRMVLTAAENQAFTSVSSSSDRKFNQTLIVTRGTENTIRYRCDMRIRGNSSRSYQFKPLRLTIPADDDIDGLRAFSLNPKASYLQHLGMRLFQAAGLAGSDSIGIELRRNGVESTTSSGSTPDFGMWVRVEPENSSFVQNHYPEADTGGLYTKRSPERYWRSAGFTVPTTPTGTLDTWTKTTAEPTIGRTSPDFSVLPRALPPRISPASLPRTFPRALVADFPGLAVGMALR
jgi:hypothetical protein